MNTSKTSNQSTSIFSGLLKLMRKHPIFSFFLLAYAISWLLSIPVVLAEWGFLPKVIFNVFFILKSFGPALAAYIMIRLTEGKEGWHNLRKSARNVRVGWHWYLFILLGIPAVFLLGILALPGALPSFKGFPPAFATTYVVSFVLIFFGGGPLGEEPGWRGFALPRLQSRYGALKATLLLGILWTFWHLPDFLTSAQGGGPGVGLSPFYTRLPIFFMMVMSLAIIFSWVFNHTHGSLFAVLLLHTSINTFGIVQPLFSDPLITGSDLPFMLGVLVLAIPILILTCGQLGYQPAPEQPPKQKEIPAGLLP